MNLVRKDEFEAQVVKESYKIYEGYVSSRSNKNDYSFCSANSSGSSSRRNEKKPKDLQKFQVKDQNRNQTSKYIIDDSDVAVNEENKEDVKEKTDGKIWPLQKPETEEEKK